jgi:hypothetical protein
MEPAAMEPAMEPTSMEATATAVEPAPMRRQGRGCSARDRHRGGNRERRQDFHFVRHDCPPAVKAAIGVVL